MISVTKEATFDCAHMLSYYEGPCKNLHGHTYKVQVTLVAPADPYTGMVLDFNLLSSNLRKVLGAYDHACLVGREDVRSEAEENLNAFLIDNCLKRKVITCGKTTCENIASDILHELEFELPGHHLKLKLWETPTSFVEIEN